jgi:hypothetical protein
MGKRFFSSTASRSNLGPIQSPVQWVPGSLIPEVRQSGLEADHLSQSSAEIKNGGVILLLPHVSTCRGALLSKHNGSYNISLPLYAYFTESWFPVIVSQEMKALREPHVRGNVPEQQITWGQHFIADCSACAYVHCSVTQNHVQWIKWFYEVGGHAKLQNW